MKILALLLFRVLLTPLLTYHASSVVVGGFAVVDAADSNYRPLLTYAQVLDAIRDGARGGTTTVGRRNTAIETLEQLWQDLPIYVEQNLQKRLQDETTGGVLRIGDEERERFMEGYQPEIARYLVRYLLEDQAHDDGAGSISSSMERIMKEYQPFLQGKRVHYTMKALEGDLQFAQQDYEDAINTYQDSINIGKEPFERSSAFDMLGRGQAATMDDVLFTKIAFACHQLGRDADAKRNWDYAAQLQEMQGLYLEAIVSFLRQEDLAKAQELVPFDLLAKYYPTLGRILKKAREGTIHFDFNNKDQYESGHDDDSLLEEALICYIQGNYGASYDLFAKIPDINPEKWGLFSLLLRERQMDDLADCYSMLEDNHEDPFSLMKRATLKRNVRSDDLDLFRHLQTQNLREASNSFDALDALNYARRKIPPINDYEYSASDLLLQAMNQINKVEEQEEEADSSSSSSSSWYSSMRANIYYQLARYLRSSTSSIRSAEDEIRRDESMLESQSFLDLALAEPGISLNIWTMATMTLASTELSIVERRNIHGDTGAGLEPNNNNRPQAMEVAEATLVAVPKPGADEKPFVPRKPKRDETQRRKRQETLMQCWDRLEELGVNETTVALSLARQMNCGAKERKILAVMFGKTSPPLLNTREAEAREDMNTGSGERAEELFRELMMEESLVYRKPHFMQDLIRALEKQGKYDDAIHMHLEYQQTDYYKRQEEFDGGDNGYYKYQLGSLYQKKGDLDMASTTFGEVTTMGGQWNTLGYLGLGEVALERKDLEQAIAQLHKGVELAERERDRVFAKEFAGNNQKEYESSDGGDYGEESMAKGNAMAGVTNAWYNAAETLSEQGYVTEALEFYRGALEASDNKWFGFGADHRERYQKRVSNKIQELGLAKDGGNKEDPTATH